MLESIRQGQRWLTLIFVSVIGLVFVFFFGTGGGLQGGPPSGNTVIELDDTRLTNVDLSREKSNTEARLRQQLGDAYDQVGADQYLDSQALTSLLNGVVLAAAAREVGLHVTKDELRRVVQASPAFIDDEGRFNPQAFDNFAIRNFGTQRLFIQSFTREVLGQKLVQLLVGQTELSDGEIDLRTNYDTEEVRIAYVAVDPEALPVEVVLEDAEIEGYASANAAELQRLFDERAEELSQPERVRARHILILAAEDAEQEIEDSARGRADAAHGRVIAGEGFEVVAAEVSEDSSTASEGGELGAFARGANAPQLDEAAFSMEVGQISEVIRTPYGFHILKLDEKLPASTPSFDSLRSELARDAAETARAAEIANETIALLTSAVATGTPLEEAAREAGLTLERPSAMRRRPDGFIPGLGTAKEVLTAAFALESGQSSPDVFDVGGKRVLLQVLERTSPGPEELATQREARRAQLLGEKQNRILSAWLDDYRLQLEKSGRLRVNIAAALGG